MSVASPLALLALLVIPLLGIAARISRRRRARHAVRHPGAATIAALGTPRRWRRHVPVALLGAAAVAMAVAFAKPQAVVAVPVEQASVELVTDHSGSMVADDVQPSRLGAAQAAARTFLDRVPDDLLVGFTGFSDGVDSVTQPTADHDAVRTAIGNLDAGGGTATGDALTAALDQLEARGTEAPAAIVLLSDGETTVGSDPLIAARRAATLKIPIYAVALGTAGGVVSGPNGEPIAVPPDPDTLRRIAEASGGAAYQASDAKALDQVYEKLGSRIGTKREKRDVSAGFAAAGLVLLVGGVGTGLRRRPVLI
jgi:Ca-activated chloride channel family protein